MKFNFNTTLTFLCSGKPIVYPLDITTEIRYHPFLLGSLLAIRNKLFKVPVEVPITIVKLRSQQTHHFFLGEGCVCMCVCKDDTKTASSRQIFRTTSTTFFNFLYPLYHYSVFKRLLATFFLNSAYNLACTLEGSTC